MYEIKFLDEHEQVVETLIASDMGEPMWMAAGLDVLDFHGIKAFEAELPTLLALKNLRAAPDYYRTNFEMVGGSYDLVETFLENMYDLCVDEPDLTIEVGY